MTERVTTWQWLGGWSIPPAAYEATFNAVVPKANANWHYPGPIGLPTLQADLKSSPGHTVVAGYSLGSLLVLDALRNGWRPDCPIRLFAPVTTFLASAGDPGKITAAQLQLTAKRLRADPTATILRFYKQNGLTVSSELLDAWLPTIATDKLMWGLTQLREINIGSNDLQNLVADTNLDLVMIIGANDPLIDAKVLAQWVPDIQVVPTVGHDLAELMQAAMPQ